MKKRVSKNGRKTALNKRATATKKKISPQAQAESAGEILGARATSVDKEKMGKADQIILSRHAPVSAMNAIADSAPVLIWINSPTGCEFVNREFLEFLGVDEAEALGGNWVEFVHPEDREGYVNAYDEAVSRRGRIDVEFRFRRRDGEYRWYAAL
jgi:PAS domain S-box-containing protein